MKEAHFKVGPSPLSSRADQVMVPMRDGVRLATDVYLPADAKRSPVVLVRVPYDKCSLYTGMEQIAQFWNDAGYVFVAQDVRGKFRSEGWSVTQLPWMSEATDGADTVEWLASAAFSDGSIGMVGDSYYAFTQWAAASEAPPALRAIVPRVASGVHDSGAGFTHGPFSLAGPVSWLAYTWIDEGVHEGPLNWSHRPLIDVVESAFGVRSSAMDILLQRSNPWAWPTFPGVIRRDRIKIPVLHWAGWWDNLKKGNFRQYRAMRHQAGAGPQHLIVDSMDHEMTKLDQNGGTLTEAIDAGNTEAVARFWEGELCDARAFLDLHLRGLGNVPPPVRWHQGRLGWQQSDEWPPKDARVVEWFLTGAVRAATDADGGGFTDRPPVAEQVKWDHDPINLVPDLSPDPSGYKALLHLVDETSVQSRPDVLTFTSEPMRSPLDLAGPVSLLARIESNHPSTQLVAKLTDIGPDNSTLLVAEGARIVHAHRFGGLVEVELGDVGYRLLNGHRLRLEVASSRFPRYLPHPGTDEDPWKAIDGSTTRQTLYTGGTYASHLRLFALPPR
jgi:predicted acyl esterase